MKRFALALAALTILVVPMQAQAAQTRSYIAGPGGLAPQNQRAEAPGIGGVIFKPTVTPTKVKVTDALPAGQKILFKVCQPWCAEAGAFIRGYCVNNGTTVTLPAGLNATQQLYVIVYIEETVGSLWVGSVGCPEGLATTGTVTLT